MNERHSTRQSKRCGLSFIEVIIVLAVFALLVAFAWPRYSTWRKAMLRKGLVESLETGDREATLKFLTRGAPPDAWSGATPHYCLRCEVVLKGDLEMAELVFPAEQPGKRLIPPHNPPFLNLAVALQDPEMVALLLESDIDVNRRVSYGYHKYKFSGSPGDALLLVRDLIVGHRHASTSIPEAIIGSGLYAYAIPAYRMTDTEEPGEENRSANLRKYMHLNTLLHDAVVLDNGAILQRLLERGADPDLRDASGKTALQLANRLGRDDLAAILLEAGACTECPDSSEGGITSADNKHQTFDD